MMDALLYNIKVKYLKPSQVEISMIPNWLGRMLRRSIRTGTAHRGWSQGRKRDRLLRWWWDATDRFVGNYIERYIEAAPVMSLEDMPVELLLKDGNND